jgi:hypothetical protein
MRNINRREASHGAAGHDEICNLIRRRNWHIRKDAATIGRNAVYAHCALRAYRYAMAAVKAHPILAFAHRWLSIFEFKYADGAVFYAFSAPSAGDSHFDFHLLSPFLFICL